MKMQTIRYFGEIINYIYSDNVTMKAGSEFLLLAKSILDTLHLSDPTEKYILYLQHYYKHGSLLSRGQECCKIVVTDGRHKAEVGSEFDTLKQRSTEILKDVLDQWKKFASLTKAMPFEFVS